MLVFIRGFLRKAVELLYGLITPFLDFYDMIKKEIIH